MEIKKLLDKWSIGINLVTLVFLFWLFGINQCNLGFGELALTVPFFIILVTYSFIHLFIYSEVLRKFKVAFIDLLGIFIFLALRVLFDDGLLEFLSLFLMLYIIPAIIISLLSWGLTKLFMWIKFRGAKK